MMKATLSLCLLAAMLHLTVHSLTQTDHHNDKPKATHPQELHPHEGDPLESCQQIVPSNTNFAFRFYRQATTQESGKNIFFSPISISTAFALLALGSRATSQAQVLEGLAFNLTNTHEEEIHNGFHHLLFLLNRPGSQVQLSMGNTLFMDKHLKPLKTFLKDIKKLYKGKVVSSNFQNSTKAKKEINDHIKNKTHGNINQILKDLDPNTLMVIVNYIYFKAYWENPFNIKGTHNDYFHVNAKTSVEVKMMTRDGFYKTYSDRKLSCEVVQIPYKGDVAALFILPNEGKMKQLEDALTTDIVSKWEESLERRKRLGPGSEELLPGSELFGRKMKSALYLCLLLLGLQVKGQHGSNLNDEQQEQKVPHFPEDHSQVEGENLAHVKIAPSNVEFAFRFYKQVREEAGNKNIFFSPLSISTAFAMLSLGARSNTLRQLHKGLAFNLTDMEEREIHEGFQHVLQLLNDPHREVQLSMGNALFIHDKLKLLQKFLDDATNFYYSEAIYSNFQNSSKATKEINDYIETKTHGKIVRLFNNLSQDTIMVLVNYIFFKGYWEKPFKNFATRDDDFLLDAKNSVKVKMMHQSKNFDIHRDEKLSCWVVEIPYKGNATALFVLPDEGTMKQVEDALLKETVSNWMQSLENRKIYLDLPKFSISGSYDIKSLFEKMGMTELFSDTADLSGMAEETLLKVSKAIHKATVDVSENGTEAAAATAIELVVMSAGFPPPLHIRFNRPFLMIIVDKTTHGILFMGKIVNPTAKED
ncbi:alpha-1-antitrypsin-like [Grus japonensis]|uniref:Alpha-1-antitrypsin-like n=1 Tax=Grus japonensis TaxID=30415 RepID=A0ABC9WZY5_GRUJA